MCGVRQLARLPRIEPVSIPNWAFYKAEDLLGLNIENEIVIH